MEFHLVLTKNEILGLVGESGSGKSTISKILTKLIEYDEGNISFNNVDISSIKSRKDLLNYRKKFRWSFKIHLLHLIQSTLYFII